MSIELHPQIQTALDRFARRRRSLLLIRAILSMTVIALALLVALALLDRARLLPDAVRPWTSLAAYAAAGITAWRVALRFLKKWHDPLGNARLMDAASCGASESILSAVELSQHSDPNGSEEFLARLQDEAAEAAMGFDHRRALPGSTLTAWSIRLAGAVALTTILALIPGLHVPGFLARAALPFSEIERPASVRIVIVEPSPASAPAPFVSDLEIVTDIVGPLPNRVLLEIAQPGSARRQMELAHQGGNRFSGTLSVGQTDLEYRIRASDALTAWHRIEARPRPAIQSFVKTLTPPDYISGEPLVLTDDHGDIEAVEGTRIHLSLQADQPLESASLSLNPDTPDAREIEETTLMDRTRIEGTWTVSPELHSWKPSLISAETGFSNDEASPWRIVSVADLPPLVQLTQPTGQIASLPDESIRLSATASDDIGLKSIDLATAVDGTDWKRTTLDRAAWVPETSGPLPTSSVFSHNIALGTIGLGAGDVLLVKFVATDLKGQESESDTLRIAILDQIVDPAQRRWAATQEKLARVSDRLRDEITAATDAIKTLAKRQSEKENDRVAEARTDIQAALDRAKETTEELWNDVKSAAREAPTPLARSEASLLGRQAAELREALVPALAAELSREEPNSESTARAAGNIIKTSSTVRDAARTFAAEAATHIAVQSADHLERQTRLHTQQALAANRDDVQRPRWQERQKAAAQSAMDVAKDIEAAAAQLKGGGEQKALLQSQKEIAEAANDLVTSLDGPDQNKSPEHLYGASDHLRQRLTRAREAATKAATAAASSAAKMRENLARYQAPALARLNEARAELLYAANPAKAKPRKDNLTHQESATEKLEAAARLLEAEADLSSQSAMAPSPLAPEISRAARAAEQLARNAEAVPASDPPNEQASKTLTETAAKAESLMQAAKALDNAALVQQAADSLNEATEALAAESSPLQPMSLDSKQTAEAALASSEQLKQAGAALQKDRQQEPAAIAQRAANEARAASGKLAEQASRQQAAESEGKSPPAAKPVPELDRAQEALMALNTAIAPLTDAARSTLDELTPAMSEMMKALAQDLQNAGADAAKAADQAADNAPVEEVASEATALQPEAAENARRMESLQNALRQEANQSDLAQLDERQLSRTADVALAQMRDQAPEVSRELRTAAQSQQSQPQQQSLQNAADMQQQTAQALQQLAQNFQQMEQGEALTEEQLAALSEMERSLGVQEALDSAYDRAQELADLEQMAQDDPSQALAMLERELPTNPVMQKALAEIAKGTAQDSEASVVEGAQQPAMMGLATELAAHELARVARHQERLGQQAAAKETASASQSLQATAEATKSQPAKATPQQGQQAAEAAAQAAQAATQTASEIPPAPTANPLMQLQGFMLAQALDQLDQELNPMQSGQPGDQQQGQQGQQSQQQGQQQQQKGAQQSLSDAQQSQQQSMAQSRNQGQVPGTESPDQKMAENNKPSEAEQPTQTNNSGNFNGPLQDGGILADALLLEGGGLEWGRLPARTAEDLSEATRREAAPEYRAAIESYYNAIARRAKEP